jgi:hypothetical protein
MPLSTFALGGEAVRGDVLVVYSQGLSPNARIALAQTAHFCDTLLLTSTEGPLTEALRARGVHVVLLEPRAPEAGLLLRVAGPGRGTRAPRRCWPRRWTPRMDILRSTSPLSPRPCVRRASAQRPRWPRSSTHGCWTRWCWWCPVPS